MSIVKVRTKPNERPNQKKIFPKLHLCGNIDVTDIFDSQSEKGFLNYTI